MLRLTPPGESDGARTPKACHPCARVKVKCEIAVGDEACKRYDISNPGFSNYEYRSDFCHRCRRLNKICNGQTPGAHRRKYGKASEVARLEEKLDGVAAFLTASQRIPTAPNDFRTPHPTDSTPVAYIDRFVKSYNEAETMLHVFRNELTPLFPFVVIPPSMTFADLREKQPFLALVILMIGCRHDHVQQTAISKAIRDIISHNIFIKGERNLDILQSLLVYVNWLVFRPEC